MKNNVIRAILHIIIILTVITTSGLSENDYEKVKERSLKEINDNFQEDLFESMLLEAKTNYADAMIAIHFQDSLEASFLFDKIFEITSQLLQIDSLTEFQEDEVQRFITLVTDDYNTHRDMLSDLSFVVPTIREQIDTLESAIDTVEIEGNKLIVLRDEDGHIPIVMNNKIKRIINFFCTRERDNFQDWLNRIEKYKNVILPIIKDYGLPEEIFYLAVIESGLNPRAYSWAHAAGPWQFIVSTARIYGLKRNWWVDERRDPVKSTHAACQYLKDLYNYFQDWFLAMAAYNTGRVKVERAIRRENTRDYWKLRTLPLETRNYVPTMMAAIIIAENPEKYSFTRPEVEPWEFDVVELEGSYELEVLARCAGISPQTLKEYNPELRRWSTPPDQKTYTLRIPKNTRDRFLKELPKAPHSSEKGWLTHRVRRGESLYRIARKYGVSISDIVAANNIRNKNRIRVGQKLLIPVNGYSRYASKSSRKKSSRPEVTNVPNHRPIIYVVKKGDTLGHIAEYYNTRASKIRKWNGLRYGEYIYPGQKLTVWVPEDSEF